MELYHQLGYLKLPENFLIDSRQLPSCPPHKVVVLCTGSQGEPNSILWRLATGDHRSTTLRPDDTIVLSARTIPGKQKQVGRLYDVLMRQGVKIYAAETAELDHHGPLHISGHAKRDDMIDLIKLIRPQFLMPIHGDYFHLAQHAELAVQAGLRPGPRTRWPAGLGRGARDDPNGKYHRRFGRD